MKITSTTLSTLFLFILLAYSALADPFTTTMEEGQEETFVVGDRNYAIEVMIIEDATPATVTLQINRQITPQMIEDQQFRLNDGILLTITNIWLNEAGEAGSGDTVTFSLTEYCGDNICSSLENCGSCVQDCGCQNEYYCSYSNSCEPIECGDDICSPGETCSEDACCDGQQMNLVSNNANCGACGTVCKRNEQCVESVCTSKDKSREIPQASTKKKIAEKSEDLDQCKLAAQCDDSNPCTVDACAGTPKKCSSDKQEGCVHGTICLEPATTLILDGVVSYCDEATNSLKPQQAEGKTCAADYECQSGMCRQGFCYVERPNLWETILGWFGFAVK